MGTGEGPHAGLGPARGTSTGHEQTSSSKGGEVNLRWEGRIIIIIKLKGGQFDLTRIRK